MLSMIQLPTTEEKTKLKPVMSLKLQDHEAWIVLCYCPTMTGQIKLFLTWCTTSKILFAHFFYLITGKGDTLKVRKAEKELGRFPGCRPREKQVNEPEVEKALQSRFLQSFITPKLSGILIWHASFMITIVITFENVSGTSKCVWPHNVNKRSTG